MTLRALFDLARDRLAGRVPRGMRRSSQWLAVRRAHLERHPRCACCGGRSRLEVHHIVPFHHQPALELEPTNLITLCRKGPGVNCHLFVGHLGSFQSWNEGARTDARRWAAKVEGRP